MSRLFDLDARRLLGPGGEGPGEFFAQQSEGAAQVAFDGGDGHAEGLRNFVRRQILLVAQDHDGAGSGGQGGHQLPELAVEKRIAGAGVDGQRGEIHEAELRGIGGDLGATVAVADPVNGAVHGGSAKPVKDVGV